MSMQFSLSKVALILKACALYIIMHLLDALHNIQHVLLHYCIRIYKCFCIYFHVSKSHVPETDGSTEFSLSVRLMTSSQLLLYNARCCCRRGGRRKSITSGTINNIPYRTTWSLPPWLMTFEEVLLLQWLACPASVCVQYYTPRSCTQGQLPATWRWRCRI